MLQTAMVKNLLIQGVFLERDNERRCCCCWKEDLTPKQGVPDPCLFLQLQQIRTHCEDCDNNRCLGYKMQVRAICLLFIVKKRHTDKETYQRQHMLFVARKSWRGPFSE